MFYQLITGQPPLVLIYPADGNPTVQCIASSADGGKTFSKYAGNPVVKQITPGGVKSGYAILNARRPLAPLKRFTSRGGFQGSL